MGQRRNGSGLWEDFLGELIARAVETITAITLASWLSMPVPVAVREYRGTDNRPELRLLGRKRGALSEGHG